MHCAPRSVKAFGAMEVEVMQFPVASMGVADVVILDEHLEYDDTSYRGTAIVKQLVKKGFPGLICMRSANCSETDQQRYLEHGAHCVLSKDMSGKETMECIAQGYAQLGDSRRLSLQSADNSARN